MRTLHFLVTAFDPFGGETLNASEQTLARLPEELYVATEADDVCVVLHKHLLPTAFQRASRQIRELLRVRPYDAVVSMGEAGGRSALMQERVAINVDDASIPDNDGDMPRDRTIIVDGPAAYFSTLPLRDMMAAIRAAGIPTDMSSTAGTFVCNRVMYTVLHFCAQYAPDCRVGFVHLPNIPEQAMRIRNRPSMHVRELVRGMVIGLEEIAKACVQ